MSSINASIDNNKFKVRSVLSKLVVIRLLPKLVMVATDKTLYGYPNPTTKIHFESNLHLSTIYEHT